LELAFAKKSQVAVYLEERSAARSRLLRQQLLQKLKLRQLPLLLLLLRLQPIICQHF